jgi:serine/threonine protein kinase
VGSAEEFGPYVVHEQLGLGGMATVHRAETQGIAGFSKQVALKRMLPSVAADANLVKSFIREARLASHLRHANVAQTYDLGKVGDTYFIAMELVPGRNLREILKHCAQIRRHVPVGIVLNIVSQICDALDYAHNLCDESGAPLGIIHRDVSPSNIILGEGGIIKLIDFGIAKASSNGMQTMSGTIKGKFGYMAPEYLMGHIDWRADLFAVGVIAHELLSNKPLFQGRDDMDTLYRVKDLPILPPSRINPDVPPEIDNIVMTALERDPNRRWQQANAMRAALMHEAKRLGLLAQNQAVETWFDQAFTATFGHESSEPEISMSNSTRELSKGSVPDDFLNVAADSIETAVRPHGSQPIQAQGTPIAKDSSPTLSDRPSRQMAAQRADSPKPRADSPKPRQSSQLVPRGEFDDAPRFNDDPPTRADASAIDSLAQSPLARRDDQRTLRTPGMGGLGQETVVAAPSLELLAQQQQHQHQNFAETTVADAAAMQRLADSPLARESMGLEAQTLPHMKRAETGATDPDGVAASSSARIDDRIDTTPRRPTPRPQPQLPSFENPRDRDNIPTAPRRVTPLAMAAQPAPRSPSPSPQPLIPPSGARTQPGMAAQPSGLASGPSAAQRTRLGVDAPSLIPSSGARTQPHMPQADTGAAPIVSDGLSDVLADLGHRPERTPSMPTAPRGVGSRMLLPLLVLIVAGVAAGVVYFALPYFT